MKIRPWGFIDNAISLSNQKSWFFVGVIGTEERSICAWKHLHASRTIASSLLVKINDEYSEKYKIRTENAYKERLNDFTNNGGRNDEIIDIQLMTEYCHVFEIARNIEKKGPSIILDVTSFPKRFFFLILQLLIESDAINDILLTYTSPQNYVAENENLYEEIQPPAVLPGFDKADGTDEKWVVSVGFLVESLSKYIGDNDTKNIDLLMPFPAPLSMVRRTWNAVANLECSYSKSRFSKIRIETTDISSAFNRICSICPPEGSTVFAPFGPKTISIAMCLYAMQKKSSVFYPQPTVYHPNYSIGIKDDNPKSAINAYWVKHCGENLYQI